MSAPTTLARSTVTVVVHGLVWPTAVAVEHLTRRIADAFDGAQILEAREHDTAPHGPSATVNDALARATGDVVLVLEPSVDWTPEDLLALASAGTSAIVGAHVPSAPSLLASDEATPTLDALRDALSTTARAGAARQPYGWAAPRIALADAGGLDATLWLFGAFDDLCARSIRRGTPTTTLTTAGLWRGPEAYPLRPPVAAFLRWRNALRHTLLNATADEAGVQLAITAASAIAASWAASGLDDAPLVFGDKWSLALENTAGVMVPLLALDAVAHDLTHLHAVRHHRGLRAEPLGAESEPCRPAAAGARATSAEAPTVSVIVVSWNGLSHLEPCFASLEASDYPAERLELVCVDNGSTDGSVAFLRTRFPRVTVVELERNRGFTAGNQAGVEASTGDVLVFLNNDMRVEPDMLSKLVGALSPDTASVAARVLSWDGRAIDFVRGTINFEARGFQEHYGERNRAEWSASGSTFFPNGGAFAITRDIYTRARGFDPAYFAYYDDVDLGWRTRLAGSDVRVESGAVAYHRHGATSRRHPQGQKRYLMDRNAVWTAFKNYGTRRLRRVFGAQLVLAVVRLMHDVRLASASPLVRALSPFSPRCASFARTGPSTADVYDVGGESRRHEAPWPAPGRHFSRESFAALGHALGGVPTMLVERRAVQAMRVCDDAAVVPHFGRALEYGSSRSSYIAMQQALVDTLGLPDALRGATRVLVITHEPLKRNISGPGIRALEIGRALADVATVTIATPAEPEVAPRECVVAPYSYAESGALRRLAERADVLIVSGFTLAQFPFLAGLDTPIVVDLYCPFTLEHLEMTTAGADARGAAVEAANILTIQNDQLQLGDYFICASERQRDFWIGALHTAGRINPQTYAADSTLRALIDVVPFGLPDEPAESPSTVRRLKGRRAGIAETDRVIVWGGSMLDWQDPETLVRAVAQLSARRPEVKLFFMGTKHPNPQVKPARVVDRTIELARSLNVLDRQVFFNDWVPYDERAGYLLDADLGVSTHTQHLETRYSFRTRMLDYIWAGLPIVCTEGDFFADLVRERRLGLTVPAGNVDALATALETLLTDGSAHARCRSALRTVSSELTWSAVVGPLRTFVRHPRFAPDREGHVRRVRSELAKSFRLTKWAKRTALSLGVGEGTIERAKSTAPVRVLMTVRNRLARRRAERRARQS
ncbi:MAG: glycosyltransferase [Vicinamibacterales bacterium]